MNESPENPALSEIRDFVEQLRSMKYSDSRDFREMCEQYAQREGCTVEHAISVMKPICDARESL